MAFLLRDDERLIKVWLKTINNRKYGYLCHRSMRIDEQPRPNKSSTPFFCLSTLTGTLSPVAWKD
jgi:hypothetical protein